MSNNISKLYSNLNTELHQKNQSFGNSKDASGTMQRLPLALRRMSEEGSCKSLLDYGTGKGQMIEWLKETISTQIEITGYDPAIEKYANLPTKKSDIVTCLDVLEHVELT